MRFLGFLGAVFWLTSTTVLAQEQKKTLTDLIESAKTHLPILKQKAAQLNAAKAVVTDVEHSFLPQIRASAQYSFGSDNALSGVTLPFISNISISGGNRADNKLEPATGSLAVLYGEYELYNFGLNNAKRNAVNAFIDLNNSDLQREMYLIELNVAKTYFYILKNQNKLATEKQNIERYESLFDLIRAQVRSGLRPGSDTSSAKAEISKAHISYNQTLGTLNQYKVQLTYLTGINSEELLAISFEPFRNNDNSKLIVPGAVLTTNPLIDYLYKKKNIYDLNEKVIEKSFLPKIVLGASVLARGSSIQYNDNYQSLLEGFGFQRFNYVVGAAINYNLLNNLYKRDKVAIYKIQTEANDFEIQQQVETLNTATLQAENAIQTARANLLEIPNQILAAQETYSQKLAQYKSGLISLNDLRNAALLVYRAQSDEVDFQTDWFTSQLERAAATGNLDAFIQSLK